MQTEIFPYLESFKQRVKRQISNLLSDRTVRRVANNAFTSHLNDKAAIAFLKYYRETVDNRSHYLQTPNFFKVFKYQYSLQGIDGAYLDKLEEKKETILRLIDNNALANLYFEFFAHAKIKRGNKFVQKNLGSFFTKLVHTFGPNEFCPLDNPIKNYFDLGNESFYIALMIISHEYKDWAADNSDLMRQIRIEFEHHKEGQSLSAKMTDIKLLDLIFWHQANVIEKQAKLRKNSGH